MSTIIETNIRELAEVEGWTVNEKTVSRIAKAKDRFFGVDSWGRCPCYPPDDTIHGCGTVACAEDIAKDGVCHCNLYFSVDKSTP